MADPLSVERKIANWIVASGRGIEMATARAAREAGALALQGVPYIDVETGKQREADVMAEFSGRGGTNIPVTLVVECKRANGKHWVTFPYEQSYLSFKPIEQHALAEQNSGRVVTLERLWAGEGTIFAPDPPISNALVEADLRPAAGESQKPDNVAPDAKEKIDPASSAIRQVWSAAQGLRIEGDRDVLNPTFRIILPVIVTGATLWIARLADNDEPQLSRADYLRVRSPATENAVLIHVMGPDRFVEFAQQVARLQERS